jgi:hypothetical protein
VAESVVRVAQEDQAQDRDGVLVGAEAGISAELIRRIPQAFLEFRVIGWHTDGLDVEILQGKLSFEPETREVRR